MSPEDIRTLARIDGNVAHLRTEFDRFSTDHEKRLRAVERKQWYHTGGLAVVGVVATKLGLPWLSLG